MIHIAILGAGNIGHALAAVLGSRSELSVRLWGRSISKSAQVEIRASCGDCLYAAGPVSIDRSIRNTVAGADIVVLTVPANIRHSLLARIRNQLGCCAMVVSWEGMGSFSESLHELNIKGPAAVGLQRSPVICRLRRRYQAVDILGLRSQVVAATVQPEDIRRAKPLLECVFPFSFCFAPNYACVSLSPGNPLIHPARLYSFAHGVKIKQGTRFYAHWDDLASKHLLALHYEFSHLRSALGLPAKFMRTLVDRGPISPSDVTQQIRAEHRLDEVMLPLLHIRGISQLDTDHRFFCEDIGEGLAYILRCARSIGITMTTAEAIHRWYLTTHYDAER